MKRSIVVVGSINVDLVVRTNRNPQVGETLQGSDFAIFTGGKGANQAAAAARLGHDVHLIGKVGSDVFAAKPLNELRETGVHAEAVGVAEGPTGMASILTTAAGDNTIIVVPGANAHVLPADLVGHRSLIEGAGIVLTQLETPMETLTALAVMCEQSNTPLILDPAPAQELPAHLLSRITWFTPNETEAALLSGRAIDSSSGHDLRAAAEFFLSAGVRNVVLKLGARGVYLATEDGTREHIDPFQVVAEDSTAAGDAFNGGFAVALMRGDTPVEAARFASAVAAISVTRRGALPSMPRLNEVNEFLAGAAVNAFPL
ncbi:MAG TPA: ribokinase [Acidobacteriaceae bacterium]